MSDGFGGDGFTGSGEVDNGEPPAPTGLVTVQTDAGLANANSYIDIDFLYAYADEVGYQIAIDETPVTIEQAILRAMPHTDGRQAEFFGSRSTATQRTAFPRTGTYADHARTAYTPQEALRAQAAYALAELSFDAVTDNGSVHAGKIKRKREKSKHLEEEVEYFDGAEVFSDYGHAKAKGDVQIEIILANSLVNARLSQPIWVGA